MRLSQSSPASLSARRRSWSAPRSPGSGRKTDPEDPRGGIVQEGAEGSYTCPCERSSVHHAGAFETPGLSSPHSQQRPPAAAHRALPGTQTSGFSLCSKPAEHTPALHQQPPPCMRLCLHLGRAGSPLPARGTFTHINIYTKQTQKTTNNSQNTTKTSKKKKMLRRLPGSKIWRTPPAPRGR